MSVKVVPVTENGESAARTMRTSPAAGAVRLAKLLRSVDAIVAVPHSDLEIREIAYDSRKVKPGTLFVAIRGERTDGNTFVLDAVAQGALAIASEQPIPATLPADFPWIQVPNARKALAITAANYFGRPAEVLKLIGRDRCHELRRHDRPTSGNLEFGVQTFDAGRNISGQHQRHDEPRFQIPQDVRLHIQKIPTPDWIHKNVELGHPPSLELAIPG